MIRVRNTDGVSRDLPTEERFIEICDDAGVVAFAVYQDNHGRVVIVEPNTPEGDRYQKIFKVQFAKQIKLPKFLTKIDV